jgi:alpha-tubulin suppressor-like RCC1 family protein
MMKLMKTALKTLLLLGAAGSSILLAHCVGDSPTTNIIVNDGGGSGNEGGNNNGTDGAIGPDGSGGTDGGAVDSGADGSVALNPTDPVALALGVAHACAILANGDAYCWGKNEYGETGDAPGGTKVTLTPHAVTRTAGQAGFAQGAASFRHTCLVDTVGNAYCFGMGGDGELGTAVPNDAGTSTPQHVVNDTLTFAKFQVGPSQIGAAASFTCGNRTAPATFACWGFDEAPFDGVSNVKQSNRAFDVPVEAGAINALAVGIIHICASTSGAAPVLCVGGNKLGQAGNGNNNDGNGFVASLWPDAGAPTTMSAGIGHTCALSAGVPYCWGFNSNGQTGQPSGGAQDSTTTPTRATTLEAAGTTVVSVGAGGNNSCVVHNDGKVFCVGANESGQLGTAADDGPDSGLAHSTPIGQVLGIDDAVLVAAGGFPFYDFPDIPGGSGGFACAIRLDKTTHKRSVSCWGANDKGQLGNGQMSAHVDTPVAVMGLP